MGRLDPVWRWLIVVHLACVLLLTVAMIIVGNRPVEDANLGAAMLATLLGLLGLPWSWIVLVSGLFPEFRDFWEATVVAVSALVNVGIHALIAWLFSRSPAHRT